MNIFGEKCTKLALLEAKKTLDAGNYPVGAVLVFDNQIIASGGNHGETSKNYINHAETKLFIENGEKILQASKDEKTISLYSTLEPCLMCLGVAVMNKVNRIIYLQKDPHAGACSIDTKSLGVRYQEVWPEITYEHYSDESKKMIVTFLTKQIDQGNRVEWSQKFLKLIEKT